MTGYYHVQDHSGFLMDNEVIQMAKLQKKTTTPTFFFSFFGVWNGTPLLNWKYSQLYSRFSLKLASTLSHDTLPIPLLPAGHAWHLDANTKWMWRAVIQLFPGMLGACRQTWAISSSLDRKKERKKESRVVQCNAMFHDGGCGGGHCPDVNPWLKCCPILLRTRPTHIANNILTQCLFAPGVLCTCVIL
jgi:hypothetical protein